MRKGDQLLGIVVPITRTIAKVNKKTPLTELRKLIRSEYHEARLCALLIAMEQFKKADEKSRKALFDFYLKHTSYINNWDLVDVTCPHIVGAYLLDKERSLLYRLAESDNLWEQRIAMVSTVAFIRNREYADTIAIAEKLLYHSHDLMHKAIGWMLREVGKRNRDILSEFLDRFAVSMPRTALRYAIEHYPQEERLYYLGLKNSNQKDIK